MDAQLQQGDAILRYPPRIYPIIDPDSFTAAPTAALELALHLARLGVRIAQYRLKKTWTRQSFAEAQAIGKLFRKANVCFVVNDRADIALALGADGVHVGQADLNPQEVRRIIGPKMLLGYSTHNAEQLQQAECESADYLAIGPVFQTSSKQNPDPEVGLAGVGEARSLTRKPLVGIGGITLRNAAEVLRAGADCVAMISGISNAARVDSLSIGP